MEANSERQTEAHPDAAEPHFRRALALQAEGKAAAAERSYRAALACRPEMAEAHYNLGLLLQECGRLDEAVGAYRRALEIRPDFAAAWNNLGTAHLDQEDLEAAAAAFARAVTLDPNWSDAAYNLGTARHRQGRSAEAIELYRRALDLNPQAFKACNNIAKALQDRGELEAAIAWYRRALALKPDYAEARFNLATANLLSGNLRAGWPDYEWRFQRRDWRRVYPCRLDAPRWQGEPFAGRTLIVHSEQGFGDVLQFVRYLPRVKVRGGTVVFETRRALLPLLAGIAGADRVVPLPEGSARTPGDLAVPLLSLPGVFGTELETIPAEVPYLFADPQRARRWQARIGGAELRVGLVWAGTATDPGRACPLAWFAPLTRLPGVRFYGLQKGPEVDRLRSEGLPEGMVLENLGGDFEDFADTAAAIEHLDLVIAIDTAVAHLAGAMGKPVWVLLSAVPDWRWLLEGETSPWYPTMRLFRQERCGQWGPPLTRLARRLEELAGALALARRVEGTAGLLAAAVHYHRRGERPEALLFYHRILALDDGEPEALNGVGIAAFESGNHARAIAFFQRAIAAAPGTDRFHYHLGLAYAASGRPADAAACFQRAAQLNPENRDAVFNLGRALSELTPRG
jgi:tetratricopeptide (TPR) repeat protein